MSAQADIGQGDILLRIARAAIAARFGLWLEHDDSAGFLQEQRATFVTLTKAGQLRGCIGSLQPHRSLLDDIRANAHAAAFSDPRFKPLAAEEYNLTSVEVSLLSPLSPMPVNDEADALAQMQPGVDGIVLQCGHHRATFLPQVWETLPEPQQFLSQLKRKAGLATDFWSIEIRLYRYHVKKWIET